MEVYHEKEKSPVNTVCNRHRPVPAPTEVNSIFAQAGWLPFSTADANVLNNGIASGLVGFDGTSYWAAPTYVELLNASAQTDLQTAVPTPQTTVPTPAASVQTSSELPRTQQVWLSATGTKYHSINHCGKMNPAKARQVTLSDARAEGFTQCSKCW